MDNEETPPEASKQSAKDSQIIEELQKTSTEANSDTSNGGADDSFDYASELATLNQKISELEHKNEVISREYQKLYRKTRTGIAHSDKPARASYDVDNIIKSTYRGVF